ncbi:hypothetical protein ACOSQ4_018604 [Xanthoceras sorbifolium]
MSEGDRASKESDSSQPIFEDKKAEAVVQVTEQDFPNEQASEQVAVGHLVAECNHVDPQKQVVTNEQCSGADSVFLNSVDLVAFEGGTFDSHQVELSTDLDSVGTGHSIVLDQRRSQVDVEETSSAKRRKWKRMTRAKLGDTGMCEGSRAAGKRDGI